MSESGEEQRFLLRDTAALRHCERCLRFSAATELENIAAPSESPLARPAGIVEPRCRAGSEIPIARARSSRGSATPSARPSRGCASEARLVQAQADHSAYADFLALLLPGRTHPPRRP